MMPASHTQTKRKRKSPAKPSTPSPESMGLDIRLWNFASAKLSLKESGELIRALMRAQKAKRPNRDQRMLLAVFTRDSDGDKPCRA